jgi:hypothetical protein
VASRNRRESRSDDEQTLVARLLLEQIRRDKYPSITQMSLLEEMLPAPMRRDYLNVLLEKALSTSTPSISMLRRIQQVAAQM